MTPTSPPSKEVALADELRKVLAPFYRTVDVMKAARNKPHHGMCVWADDMKAVEDVMLFLEKLRDATRPPSLVDREAPTDDEIEKVILEAVRKDKRLERLAYTSWKDGIDIERATFGAITLARAILSLVNPGSHPARRGS